MLTERFDLWCELEPAMSPDLGTVGRQVEALRPLAAGYVVADNHLSRATVSSLAVAHEVIHHGGQPIA